MADSVRITQEIIEVACYFTVPPQVIESQEIIEVAATLPDETVYVYQEIIEVACRGPYVHKYGPKVQDVG